MEKFTKVKIFGMEYSLRGEEDSEYMQELAKFVDKKMKDVAEHSSLVSTSKVAVLTALRMADELHQLKQSPGGLSDGSADRRIKKLVEMIDRRI
ncbi:cell division protein ZapA [bacterium]|nr:cell division protein ZapA [bacterium]